MAGLGLIRRYGDTDFVTGLRAVAATLVVMLHSAALSDFGAPGLAVMTAGIHGVDIFFVIAGFTVARTFGEARGYGPYIQRRLFRILPLFWVAILLAFAMLHAGLIDGRVRMDGVPVAADGYLLTMHLSLLASMDPRIDTTVLGVDWTIPIEIFWYLALPLLLILRRHAATRLAALALPLVAVVAGAEAVRLASDGAWMGYVYPFKHGLFFVAGVYAHDIRTSGAPWVGRLAAPLVTLVAIVFLAAFLIEMPGRRYVFGAATAVFLAFAHPERTPVFDRVLTWRPLLVVGSISYSLYLLHPLVLFVLIARGWLPETGLARFALVMGIGVAVSVVTYCLVERPTNRLGARLAGRRQGATVGGVPGLPLL